MVEQSSGQVVRERMALESEVSLSWKTLRPFVQNFFLRNSGIRELAQVTEDLIEGNLYSDVESESKLSIVASSKSAMKMYSELTHGQTISSREVLENPHQESILQNS
jgi:hypothetical protein